jgi:hypothetical protein
MNTRRYDQIRNDAGIWAMLLVFWCDMRAVFRRRRIITKLKKGTYHV